jgi:hypothetical protein
LKEVGKMPNGAIISASIMVVTLGSSLLLGPKTLAGTEDLKKLELKLELARSTAVQFEPVVLRFTVRNPTPDTIQAGVRTRGELSQLYIRVQYGQERPVDYGSGPLGALVGGTDKPLSPGQVLEDDRILFFNGWKRDLAFRRLGKYRITATMGVGGDREVGTIRVDSPSVTLGVVAAGDADRSMIRDLGSEDALIRVLDLGPQALCEGEGAVDCFNHLGTLVNRNKGSAYAPFLALNLARGMQPKMRLDLNGRQVSPIDLLQDSQRMWPGHPVQSRVAEALVFATVRQEEDLEGAKRLLTEFETNHPNRREAIRAMQLEMEGVRSLGDGEPPE